jgi:hypothetical protein
LALSGLTSKAPAANPGGAFLTAAAAILAITAGFSFEFTTIDTVDLPPVQSPRLLANPRADANSSTISPELNLLVYLSLSVLAW